MSSSEDIFQGIPHKKLYPIIEKLKETVFTKDVVQDIFDEYDIPEEELYLIPVCFADLDVSARTDHGCIFINVNLLGDLTKDINYLTEKALENSHYLAHEVTHYCQQTTGSKPTPGSSDANYLDNPVEQEAFQNQSRYISETEGDQAAVDYIKKVVDHHKDNEGPKKKKERMDDLLDLANFLNTDLSKIS
jgi:hypothetical protein